MAKKIGELVREPERAGFIDRGGQGSHRNFKHPCGVRITLSGHSGDDAKRYQEWDVEAAIMEARRRP